MAPRLELDQILRDILGSTNVYFQPPESVKMDYPAIVYQRDYAATQFADDQPWRTTKRYMITVIDKNPDNVFVDKLLKLPMCSFDRTFSADNLNHYNFNMQSVLLA